MKPIKKELARPGRISGQVTVRKVYQRLARKVCDACRRHALQHTSSTSSEIGANASTCAMVIPDRLDESGYEADVIRLACGGFLSLADQIIDQLE
jgi:hypothetical protein